MCKIQQLKPNYVNIKINGQKTTRQENSLTLYVARRTPIASLTLYVAQHTSIARPTLNSIRLTQYTRHAATAPTERNEVNH